MTTSRHGLQTPSATHTPQDTCSLPRLLQESASRSHPRLCDSSCRTQSHTEHILVYQSAQPAAHLLYPPPVFIPLTTSLFPHKLEEPALPSTPHMSGIYMCSLTTREYLKTVGGSAEPGEFSLDTHSGGAAQ